jgi:hypothetical protein
MADSCKSAGPTDVEPSAPRIESPRTQLCDGTSFLESQELSRGSLPSRCGVPADNTFLDNRFEQFHPTLADILIGPGVVRRRIVGPGTVLDQGARASVER